MGGGGGGGYSLIVCVCVCVCWFFVFCLAPLLVYLSKKRGVGGLLTERGGRGGGRGLLTGREGERERERVVALPPYWIRCSTNSVTVVVMCLSIVVVIILTIICQQQCCNPYIYIYIIIVATRVSYVRGATGAKFGNTKVIVRLVGMT